MNDNLTSRQTVRRPSIGPDPFESAGKIYVAAVLGLAMVKIGFSLGDFRLNTRKNTHRSYGLMMLAAWIGTDLEEHRFHDAYRPWGEVLTHRAETYIPYSAVTGWCIANIWQADADGTLRKFGAFNMAPTDALTENLDNLAWVYHTLTGMQADGSRIPPQPIMLWNWDVRTESA